MVGGTRQPARKLPELKMKIEMKRKRRRPRPRQQTQPTDKASPPPSFVLAAGLLALAAASLAGLAEAALPLQAGAQVNGLHQTMSQMLQVFNGNASDAQQLDSNHFKLLELIDEDTLLVGARNVVYNLSLTTMREQRQRLVWSSSEHDVKLCRVKGKSAEQCQNYIRVLKLAEPGVLLVCGTNAYKPLCRKYSLVNKLGEEAYEPVDEWAGEGACPYQENQNVTSTFADGQLYSATAAQFSGVDGLIHRQPLRTEQFNPRQLNSPNFVSSFRYGEHVYFLFREIAIEHINCGKTIYSRIGRVCLNDQGGASTRSRERWTSFVKARLNCSIPGDFPFHFDEIQASTHALASAYTTATSAGGGNAQLAASQTDLLYAVFTTPTNSIGGSAVCAYRMADVLAAFAGPFKSQLDSNANWLPLAESRVPHSPRPGACANDSKRLPEEHINFIRDNPLMETTVEPIWSQPLITMASINFRFTQVAVDVQVETQLVPGAPMMRTDVIFVATDDGRVFKLINTYHLQASSQAHRMLAGAAAAAPPAAATAAAQRVGAPGAPLAQQAAAPQQTKPPLEPLADVSASTIVVEELHLFDARTPIVGMLIHYPPPSSAAAAGSAPPQGKLIVLAAKQLKAVPLSRCERALSCLDCLALFDPYCAWDLERGACLPLGRSQVIAARGGEAETGYWPPPNRAAASTFQKPAGFSFNYNPPARAWFPPNSQAASALWPPVAPNNHTLAWWSACPNAPLGQNGLATPQQVGAPVRSLFASHLQVPSRFDYQSGHHLSRTQLVSLAQMAQAPPASASSQQQQQQPVSECLTFCGGIYAPTSGVADSGQLASCAELFASGGSSSLLQQNGHSLQQAAGNLYTSENLLLAVIICALLGLLLGLLFGFALGRSARSKNESSICSSTFDETNLYMASTGSHCHPIFAGAGPLSQQPSARLASHPIFNGGAGVGGSGVAGANGYALAGSGRNEPLGQTMRASHNNSNNNNHATGQLFDPSQCLLVAAASDHSSGIGSSTYANQQQQQQQLLFQHHHHHTLGAQNASSSPSASVRMGALPPIPREPQQQQQQQQAPLVSHAQLTPGSQGSSGAGTTTSSSSATAAAPATANEHQYYLQQASAQQQQQQQAFKLAAAKQQHQRSFTNGSVGSGGKPAANGHQTAAAAAAQPQNGHQQQQQANNKIYL